jgi:alpha-1,6-mannosyltransferase
LALASPPGAIIAERRHGLSLAVLTAAGVIFRSELAVLVASQTLYLLATRRVSLVKTVISAGVTGAIVGLLITVPIDSFFWQQYLLWPEWVGFYYNTILGHSSNWGTSPWHYYLLTSLPKLLFNPLIYTVLVPLAVAAPATRRPAVALLVPGLTFVGAYSLLPHKEWRFVVYIVPAFTAVGAMGASWIWNRRSKSIVYSILSLLLLASVAASFAASSALLVISQMNYPGGEAMTLLREMTINSSQPLQVYADNLACQTGVTRFLESRKEKINGQAKWNFDKTENETSLLDPMFWHQFDYVLVEHQERTIGKWDVVEVVTALDGLRFIRPGMEMEASEDAVDNILLQGRHDMWQLWDRIGEVIREKFTRGWWITVKIVPKIKILRRIKD